MSGISVQVSDISRCQVSGVSVQVSGFEVRGFRVLRSELWVLATTRLPST